jgi:hypothetical protein
VTPQQAFAYSHPLIRADEEFLPGYLHDFEHPILGLLIRTAVTVNK